LEFASNELVSKGLVCNRTNPVMFECLKDNKTLQKDFYLESEEHHEEGDNKGEKQNRYKQNIEVEIYTLKYQMDVDKIKLQDTIFLRSVDLYLTDNEELLESNCFSAFVDHMWSKHELAGYIQVIGWNFDFNIILYSGFLDRRKKNCKYRACYHINFFKNIECYFRTLLPLHLEN